ncbi:MAG: cytidine deaminase [Candidatus Nanopelagicales bacterium]
MPDPSGPVDLGPEDLKLVALARAARANAGAPQGAAVRDTMGRSYSAAAVRLPSLSLTAAQLVTAVAASSGASGLEAAVVVGGEEPDPADLRPLRDLAGAGVPVFVCGTDGSVRHRLST